MCMCVCMIFGTLDFNITYQREEEIYVYFWIQKTLLEKNIF